MKHNRKYLTFILNGASQCGYTRSGVPINIPPKTKVTKIRDTFADRIKMRNMFIRDSGVEISIDPSIIDRYFVLDDEMPKDDNCLAYQDSSYTTHFCVFCGAYFTDHNQYLLHQAMHLGLNSIDELIEYCALKHALNFYRKSVNFDDSDDHRQMYSKAKASYDEFVSAHNVNKIRISKGGGKR
jgi:hypothetical protein